MADEHDQIRPAAEARPGSAQVGHGQDRSPDDPLQQLLTRKIVEYEASGDERNARTLRRWLAEEQQR